jgi:uncharacterized protein YjaG (DUF416 family)
MEKIETKVVKPEVSFFENDVNNIIMPPQEESNLDSKIKSIEDYMRNTSGKGKTEQEKDGLYQTAQQMWHEFVESIKDAKFNFHLNRPQHKFLTDLILTKMEYDVNTVFFAIELTNMMAGLKEAKYTNDKDLLSFEVNATEITYIYHLISKHKVKGLSKDAYTFANVLYRIGNISKIFNYYETASKNLSTDVQNWVMTFEDGIEYEKFKNQETIEVESTTEVAG